MKLIHYSLLIVVLISCNEKDSILSNGQYSSPSNSEIVNDKGNTEEALIGAWNAVHGTQSGVYAPEWPADTVKLRLPYIVLLYYEQGFELQKNQIWYPRRYNNGSYSTDTLYSGNWQLVDQNTLQFTTNFVISDTITTTIVKLSSDSLILYSYWGTSYLLKQDENTPQCTFSGNN